jgi:DNA repair exonuclease SbcCD ATPase subunit
LRSLSRVRTSVDLPRLLQVAVAEHRARNAHEQVDSLQSIIETQAQDHAAGITVIERLQEELREARCDNATLEEQRAFFQSKSELVEHPATTPAAGFVPVEELVDAREVAAEELNALRDDHNALAARLAENEQREAALDAQLSATGEVQATLRQELKGAREREEGLCEDLRRLQQEAEEQEERKQRSLRDAELRGERVDALEEMIARLDTRLVETEGRLSEALKLAERAKEVRWPALKSCSFVASISCHKSMPHVPADKIGQLIWGWL